MCFGELQVNMNILKSIQKATFWRSWLLPGRIVPMKPVAQWHVAGICFDPVADDPTYTHFSCRESRWCKHKRRRATNGATVFFRLLELLGSLSLKEWTEIVLTVLQKQSDGVNMTARANLSTQRYLRFQINGIYLSLKFGAAFCLVQKLSASGLFYHNHGWWSMIYRKLIV